MIAMANMNPKAYLFNRDPFEISVLTAVAERRRDIAAEERQDLAERIISVLGRSMKG